MLFSTMANEVAQPTLVALGHWAKLHIVDVQPLLLLSIIIDKVERA